MNEYLIKSRFILLQKLHSIIKNMNDENAYLSWIYFVPDEPSEQDFLDIAEDDDSFEEVCKQFVILFNKYKKYE